MCFFGGMGGGGGAPQVMYRDNPANQIAPPLPAPAPVMMNQDVTPASEADNGSSTGAPQTPDYRGTSIFKINRNAMDNTTAQDMGIDSGVSYLG